MLNSNRNLSFILIFFRMSEVDYAESCRFWTDLFQQEQLVSNLPQLASVESSFHQLRDYGGLKLVVSRATSIGDGYLSDTYALTAHVDSGTCFTAFVKVLSNGIIEMSFIDPFMIRHCPPTLICALQPYLIVFSTGKTQLTATYTLNLED